MLLILLFFVIGISAGHVLRERKWMSKFSGYFSFVAVLLLLLLLGYEAGDNPHVSQHFDTIGLQGLIIGLCATLGSVLFVWAFAKQFLNKKQKAK